MSDHFKGEADRLHHADGTHRSTAATANGRELEWFEDAHPRHVADGHAHTAPRGKEPIGPELLRPEQDIAWSARITATGPNVSDVILDAFVAMNACFVEAATEERMDYQIELIDSTGGTVLSFGLGREEVWPDNG